MQVFNRNVSGRGLTVFGFELVLISGSMVLAANLHDSSEATTATAWKIALVTALCQLCRHHAIARGQAGMQRLHHRAEVFLQPAGRRRRDSKCVLNRVPIETEDARNSRGCANGPD